jgi:holo-[acyl-carrier protein] synthase
MILGIGADMLDIRRIEKTLDRFGERFIERCFTKEEREKAERRRAAGTHVATYAKRFAAKEAVSKALGIGFSQGVYMKDIAVLNDRAGKPELRLTGGAKAVLEKLAAAKGQGGRNIALHLTLTDEPPYAQAQVIIESL